MTRFERGAARWLLLLAVVGTIGAGVLHGLHAAGGFLVGSIGAWLNFRVIGRAVEHIAGGSQGRGEGVWVFIQFAGLVLGAFVILVYSGFSMVSALCGLLVCPAAVLVEMIYEAAVPNFQK